MSARSLRVRNGHAAPQADIPLLSPADFRAWALGEVSEGARIAALFGMPGPGESTRLVGVLAHGQAGELALATTEVGAQYQALTPECPPAHWFEREIAEQWGIRPEGHPWLKPIRFHAAYRPGRDAWGRAGGAAILPSVTEFFQVDGEEVHEVAVGPVHAGVIEPGHFRFQCHGEQVFHLEISLGYQHRGIERALVGGPSPRIVHQIETLVGDTSIGHGLAYAHAVEALTHCTAPVRAAALRGIALELERLANHIGDLGALAGDVGYLPTAAYCGRLRGEFLNLTALICGSRFGRGLVRPGGVQFDLEASRGAELIERLDQALKDVAGAVGLLWETPSVLSRFEETGTVSRETAEQLGLVGVAARGCGLVRDARFDFPAGIFRLAQIPVSTWDTGDVFARAWVRWLEVQRSAEFVREQVRALPGGPLSDSIGCLEEDRIVVSIIEGWRGEICHVALTDASGRFAYYKIVDPSFHNWMGLAMALRNQAISDFPLCNKSFNLSYCGHDL